MRTGGGGPRRSKDRVELLPWTDECVRLYVSWDRRTDECVRSHVSWGLLAFFFHLGEKVVQRLGQSGMGEDAIAQCRVGKLAHHGDLEGRHDLTAFESEDGRSQDQ